MHEGKYKIMHTFTLQPCTTNFLFFYFPVPDDLILQLLSNRLSQLDCVTRGWVLHAFPTTRRQAEGLAKAGFEPNR